MPAGTPQGAKVRRDAVIRARIPAEDYAGFEAFCDKIGLSVSEGLRRLIATTNCAGAVLSAEDRETLLQIAEEFRAIGVNINQAVRAMNTGRVPDMPAFRQDLADLTRGMFAIADSLMRQGAKARGQLRKGMSGRPSAHV